MNTSLPRAILLSLLLVSSQSPVPSLARAAGANPKNTPNRAVPARGVAPQPVRKAAPPVVNKNAAATRNPLTGSSVAAPSRTPVPPPTARKPAVKTPPVAVRPAPKPLPVAPKAVAKAAPKPPVNPAVVRPVAKSPQPPTVVKPVAKTPVVTPVKPVAKPPVVTAVKPVPKPPVITPVKPAPKPVAPKVPVTVAKRPAPVVPNPAIRPGTGTKPFVPGRVTYPGQLAKPVPSQKLPQKPTHPALNRPTPKPLNQVIANSNINSNNRVTNVTNVNKVTNVTNVTNKNINVSNNWGNQWTNNRATIWNNNRVVNNRPVVINQNFTKSVNYAYRPAAWGSRPWWSNSTYHSWHHGSWNYGWNQHWQSHHYHAPRSYGLPGYYYHPHYHDHDDNDLAEAVAWGLAAWTLGSLAFDSGYNCYRNPYPAPPVQTRTTIINYSQPLSVVAAKEEPEPEEAALTSQEKSAAAIERARAEFGNGDYLASLKSTDEAISHAPGDSALHEFRALCLFALGRYGDAAGVLNPVLASGPGWDWSTMASFYSDTEVYTGQLRKLEAYVEGSPDSAYAHFLLGYHYMVAGFIDQAYAMFDRVTVLQPADTVAAQLRTLAASSSPNATTEETEAEGVAGAAPVDAGGAPAPVETLVPLDPAEIEGSWKATSGDSKSITLTLGSDGTFEWDYEGAADGKVLSGEWSIDDENRLVLATGDVQMVADIELEDDAFRFVLEGAPVGDPGLTFQRQ